MVDDKVPSTASWVERSPLIKQFTDQCNCEVDYQEYDSTQEILLKLEQIPNYYDVVVVSSGDVTRLLKSGLLDTINHKQLENFDPANYALDNSADPQWQYIIPYLFGTTGIAYRTDMAPKEVVSWQEFYDPADSLVGSIILPSDDYLNFGLSLMASGLDPNSQNIQDIHQASRNIYHLQKNGFIAQITSDVEAQQDALINGDAAMAIMYSGDALTAIENNDKIRYVIPAEGSEFYIDGFCITKASGNKALAHQFIDFMISVETQIASSVYLNYATPHLKAIEILNKDHPELVAEPAIYPPESIMKKLKVFASNSTQIQNYWNKIFK